MVKLQNITEKLHNLSFASIFPLLIIVLNIVVVVFSFNFLQSKKYFKSEFVYGQVNTVINSDLTEDPYVPGRKLGKQELIVNILTGKEAGGEFTIYNTLSKGHNIEAVLGGKYIFSIRYESGKKKVVWLYSYNRIPLLISLLALFILLVLIVGGRKGLNSLIALSFTGVMLLFVLVPLILRGIDPIFLSIVILSIVTCVSFFLISGFSRRSFIAIIGTIGGIVAAGTISLIASKIAHLSGINMEKGEQILYIAEDFGIRINGFLFIAILISSLGAVMDVAMGITSSLEEIKKHRPTITGRDLFNSGMSIGRDLIGTMINTLILAFAGSSFTLILMISGLSMSFTQFINIPLISIEIIQGIAGSIGIILTVPLTNIAFIILRKENLKDEEKNI